MKIRPDMRQLGLCRYCPTLCQSRCPAGFVSGNISFSPWGKMSLAKRILDGELAATPAACAATAMCYECLACREACNHENDVPSNLAAFRNSYGAQGAAVQIPEEERYDQAKAWALLQSVAPTWRMEDATQVLLVPGEELLRPDSAHILKAIFVLLDLIGDKTVGITRDSVLESGHIAYLHGHGAEAMAQMKQAYKRLGRYKRVLFVSPHSLSFVRLVWPLHDLDRSKIETSLLEYVGKRIDFSGAGFFPHTVAWHDPCHMGRHLGFYQLPRDLLAWACNRAPTELAHHHDRSQCCGGGYPMVSVAKETSLGTARLVLDEFKDTGAQYLVTGCGQCVRQFKSAAPDAPVLHLFEVLATRSGL